MGKGLDQAKLNQCLDHLIEHIRSGKLNIDYQDLRQSAENQLKEIKKYSTKISLGQRLQNIQLPKIYSSKDDLRVESIVLLETLILQLYRQESISEAELLKAHQKLTDQKYLVLQHLLRAGSEALKARFLDLLLLLRDSGVLLQQEEGRLIYLELLGRLVKKQRIEFPDLRKLLEFLAYVYARSSERDVLEEALFSSLQQSYGTGKASNQVHFSREGKLGVYDGLNFLLIKQLESCFADAS